MRIAVIGVPWNSKGARDGEAQAPKVLRESGLLVALTNGGRNQVMDYGDVEFSDPVPERSESGIIAEAAFREMVLGTRAAVKRAIADNRFPVVVGGECPLLLGCLAAANEASDQRRVGLLFVDGHEDSYPPLSSLTGESADMALGLALGLTSYHGFPELNPLPGSEYPLWLLRKNDALVLGTRDRAVLEEEEIPLLATVPVSCDSEERLHRILSPRYVSEVVRCLGAVAKRWWFHLDLDVLSSEAFPAVRYEQPGGLSWEELEMITQAALAAPECVGWNITIYNPDLDPDRHHGTRLVEFLAAVAQQMPAR